MRVTVECVDVYFSFSETMISTVSYIHPVLFIPVTIQGRVSVSTANGWSPMERFEKKEKKGTFMFLIVSTGVEKRHHGKIVPHFQCGDSVLWVIQLLFSFSSNIGHFSVHIYIFVLSHLTEIFLFATQKWGFSLSHLFSEFVLLE